MWPPSSFYQVRANISLWGVVEEEASKHRHNIKESLRVAILHVMGKMQEAPLIRACNRFRRHLEAVIEAEWDMSRVNGDEMFNGVCVGFNGVSFQCTDAIRQKWSFCS